MGVLDEIVTVEGSTVGSNAEGDGACDGNKDESDGIEVERTVGAGENEAGFVVG